MPLTDTAVRHAKKREKPYKMGDALGLFLLVQPSGGKLWRFKYRFDGREKKLGLGNYPSTSTFLSIGLHHHRCSAQNMGAFSVLGRWHLLRSALIRD